MKRKRWLIFGAICVGGYYAVTLTHDYVLPYMPTGDYESVYTGWFLASLTTLVLLAVTTVLVCTVRALAYGLWYLAKWLRGK